MEPTINKKRINLWPLTYITFWVVVAIGFNSCSKVVINKQNIQKEIQLKELELSHGVDSNN